MAESCCKSSLKRFFGSLYSTLISFHCINYCKTPHKLNKIIPRAFFKPKALNLTHSVLQALSLGKSLITVYKKYQMVFGNFKWSFCCTFVSVFSSCRELSLRLSFSLSSIVAQQRHTIMLDWACSPIQWPLPTSGIPSPYSLYSFPNEPRIVIVFPLATTRIQLSLIEVREMCVCVWVGVYVCVYNYVCVCVSMCVCCVTVPNIKESLKLSPFLLSPSSMLSPQQQWSTPYSPLLPLFFFFVPLTHLKEEHKAHPLIVRIILSGILVIEIIGNARMCHLATDL